MPIPSGALPATGPNAQTLIDITLNRYLLSGQNQARNRLSVDYTPGETTLSFAYPLQGIQAGTSLSIGLNTFYVWEVHSSGQTAVVEGGMNGSVDAFAETGDIVLVNPAWSANDIFSALNEDLASLSGSGLYQMRQTQFVYSASQVGYDLPGLSDVTSVYEVRISEPDSFARTPRLDIADWRLERLNPDTSSTFSLKLFRGGVPGQTVTVLYKTPFTPFTTLTDTIASTGLPTSAFDLPPMGAAIRVAAGREVRRNDITRQGDTRRAEEVTAGAAGAATRGIMGLRLQRINEETAQLASAYPARLL